MSGFRRLVVVLAVLVGGLLVWDACLTRTASDDASGQEERARSENGSEQEGKSAPATWPASASGPREPAASSQPDAPAPRNVIQLWIEACAAGVDLGEEGRLAEVVACIRGRADFEPLLATRLFELLWIEAEMRYEAALELLQAYRDTIGMNAACAAWLAFHDWKDPERSFALRSYWMGWPPVNQAELRVLGGEILARDPIREREALQGLLFGLRAAEGLELRAEASGILDQVIAGPAAEDRSIFSTTAFAIHLHEQDIGRTVDRFVAGISRWDQERMSWLLAVTPSLVSSASQAGQPGWESAVPGLAKLRQRDRAAFDAACARQNYDLDEALGPELAAELRAASGGP